MTSMGLKSMDLEQRTEVPTGWKNTTDIFNKLHGIATKYKNWKHFDGHSKPGLVQRFASREGTRFLMVVPPLIEHFYIIFFNINTKTYTKYDPVSYMTRHYDTAGSVQFEDLVDDDKNFISTLGLENWSEGKHIDIPKAEMDLSVGNCGTRVVQICQRLANQYGELVRQL